MYNCQWILLLLTGCISLSEGYHLQRYKRQNSNCSLSEYTCESGECINSDYLCDGSDDCVDGSDEANCTNYQCADWKFKCKYGGCIYLKYVRDDNMDCKDNSDESFFHTLGYTLHEQTANTKFPCNSGDYVHGKLVCDGNADCTDASDEKNCSKDNASSMLPPTPDICTVPDHVPNGQLVDSHGDLVQPGTILEDATRLQVKCLPGYALDPTDKQEATCNGTLSEIPTCLKTCASAVPKPGSHMDVRCTLNGYKVHCDEPVDGTQATYECNSLYEERSFDQNPNRFCKKGTWDLIQPRCEPICGLKSNQVVPLIAGGKLSQKGDYPWMVGAYRTNNTEQFCGGSMITPKITLSAAHCFSEQGPADASLYKVAAGKYFRDFQNINDKDAQYSELEKLKIHPKYNNGDNFQAYDIAILVLKTPFQMTKYVLPVCLEYNASYDEKNLIAATGIVPGWGYTTAVDTPSNVLKELSLVYKSFDQCNLPPDFRPYYENARDKICAISAVSGQSLCRGDSGGGLVFRQTRDRYYIRGIVSVGLRDNSNYGCDLKEHVLFTAVAFHVDFIQRNL